MADFAMKIAGCVARIHSIFESTPAFFSRYLTDLPAHFEITVTQADVDFERQAHLQEALEEGFRPRNFPDTFLERASIQRKFAEALFDNDTLLLHGSTVAVDGKAYLFTAKSGTGKSTHTRLWCQRFGERAVMVNDDKPFLKFTGDQVLACGSPWSGKHGLDTNICVPLQGICILERGTENRIRPISPAEAMPMLLHQSQKPLNSALLTKYQLLVEELAQRTALWHMECNKDISAAETAYNAMKIRPEC
ncbi:MAG: hypothetical protein IJO45_03220 [Oscillospiraceae bacterium]|nr:hypothetical protein [Oscillospiraceae bacterium]